MKNKISVKREGNRTIVIYSAPPKANHFVGPDKMVVTKQKPVPVRYEGKILYYITADGRKIYPIRKGPGVVAVIKRFLTLWSILAIVSPLAIVQATA